MRSCFLLFLLAAAGTGCSFISQEPEILARVGQSEITAADTSYRIATENAYGNDSLDEPAALVSLVNETIEGEVARSFGLAATPEELSALGRHADGTSKAPEVLAAIKSAFGNDLAAYDRIYLAPKIVNRKLRSWYSRNPEIHHDERGRIEKAHFLASSGTSLLEVSQVTDLEYSTVDFGGKDQAMPQELKKYFPEGGQSPGNPMTALLESLSEGEVYGKIVEDDEGYRVIKLLKRADSGDEIGTITARKRPFDQWFVEEAGEIPVEILGGELADTIRARYPNVWWVQRNDQSR